MSDKKIISMRHSPGFTIVELLIVIVVIAILAAITIVAFNGIQDRARASSANQAASQAAKKLKLWQVDREGVSPICNEFFELINGTQIGAPTGNCSFDYNGTNYQYSPVANGGYCVTTTVGNRSFKAETSTTPIAGGCRGHSQAGVAAITNLISNPAVATVNTGWSSTASSGGSFTSGRTTSVSGLSSLGITTSWRINLTAAPASWWRNQFASVSVTENQPYTFSAYLRPSITVPTGVIIIWRNASGGTIVERASSYSSHSAGTWERKSVSGTAPAGAVSAVLQAGASTGGTASAYLDTTAVMFTSGSELYTYADGNSTDWAWSVAENSSQSFGPPL